MTTKIVILGLVIVVFTAGAAFFLWNNASISSPEGTPTSPVFVDILTPSNGDSIGLNQFVSLLAQAWSPNPISELQLWQDGQLIASESLAAQENAVSRSWDLELVALGVHSFYVRALDSEGETGRSATLILNVADPGFQQVSAAEGDSLESISQQFSFPIQDLSDLNPGLDPSQPLAGNQPIILPSEDQEEGEPLPVGEDGPGQLIIQWQFTPTGGASDSYCYQSVGGEYWQRVPDQSFAFLPGDEWLQTPFVQPSIGELQLFLECWGWQNGQLVFLGNGEASLNPADLPEDLIIIGDAFQASGVPKMKPMGGGGLPDGVTIPAPFALRQPESVSECAMHYGGNFWANKICDELMNASPTMYNLFVWEWSPGLCWGTCPVDHVDGYLFIETDPFQQTVYTSKDIPSGNQKVTAAPLPWGGRCYEVSAYVDTPSGRMYSDSAKFCGEQPEPEVMFLDPTEWLSTDGVWVEQGCGDFGSAPYFTPSGQTLSIGTFIVDVDDCFKQGDSSGAVKFNLAMATPDVGVHIQQAILHVNQIKIAYAVDSEVAIGAKPSLCATRVGKASADWTGLSTGHFIDGVNHLSHIPYAPSYTNYLSSFGEDVTAAVLGWIENPASNRGFILSSSLADLYNSGWLGSGWDHQTCFSLVNVQLEIRYFSSN